MINFGPGQEYALAAIGIGIILLILSYFSINLGVLGQILTVIAVVLIIVWALYLLKIL